MTSSLNSDQFSACIRWLLHNNRQPAPRGSGNGTKHYYTGNTAIFHSKASKAPQPQSAPRNWLVKYTPMTVPRVIADASLLTKDRSVASRKSKPKKKVLPLRNLWLTLAWADCGEKSSGSRRESHVIASYCKDFQRKTGQFGTAKCRVINWSEVPYSTCTVTSLWQNQIYTGDFPGALDAQNLGV